MSFIFQDKNFLKFIYKMADGPATATVPLSEDLVSKFFDNLAQQAEASKFSSISGEPATHKVGDDYVPVTSTSTFNQPSVNDISNLKSFVLFCWSAGVKVSGNFIVTETAPSPADNNNIKPLDQTRYYVNVKDMSFYLEFLKSSPDYKTNRIYIYMLGELIQSFNQKFSQNVPRFEDTVIVKLKQQVDISKNLQENVGDRVLKVGDLFDFSKWFADNVTSVSNVNVTISDKPWCSLLKYLYERPEITDANIKQRLRSCGSSMGCPVETWAATPAATQAPAATAVPGVPIPGAPATTTPSLDATGVTALRKLLMILDGGGPFQEKEVFVGYSMNEEDTVSLVSFANNAEKYFASMSATLKQPIYQSFATEARNAASLVWNLYLATQANQIISSTKCSTASMFQTNLDYLYSQGKVGMTKLLTVVENVCKLNAKQEKIEGQRRNHGLSRDIVYYVSINNRAPDTRRSTF